MADKSYESYEMLAKLLNSGRKENIDSAYDALSDVISGEYQKKKQDNQAAYAEKRNALAVNKAKADKYLDYFMTEKGYEGSGIEADAKLKANIGYNSDLASLNASEALAASEIDNQLETAKLKNEIERNSKKADADKDLGDTLYKAYNDEQNRELEKYFKEKEYAIKQMEANTNAAKAAASSSAAKKEAALLQEKLNSYRQLLYQDIKSSFDLTDDINEKQRIYDSVTGVNTEAATEIYGDTLYKNMIKDFSKALTEAKKTQSDAAVVQKLYNRFVDAKDEYHYQTYKKLKRELEFSNFPGFTADQLDRAYKAYLKNEPVA